MKMNKSDMRYELKRFLLESLQVEAVARDENTLRRMVSVLEYNREYLGSVTISEVWEIVSWFHSFLKGDCTLGDLRQEINTMLRYCEE